MLNPNDEGLTLPYGVLPIIKYLNKDDVVLCPFDTNESAFVKVLRSHGFKVHHSHIREGKDFFKITRAELRKLGITKIISNPPFSARKEVVDKLFELDKPFAIILPMVSIALKNIRVKLDQCEILCFDERMRFIASGDANSSSPPSEIIYLCHKVLPNQIINEKLKIDRGQQK